MLYLCLTILEIDVTGKCLEIEKKISSSLLTKKKERKSQFRRGDLKYDLLVKRLLSN